MRTPRLFYPAIMTARGAGRRNKIRAAERAYNARLLISLAAFYRTRLSRLIPYKILGVPRGALPQFKTAFAFNSNNRQTGKWRGSRAACRKIEVENFAISSAILLPLPPFLPTPAVVFATSAMAVTVVIKHRPIKLLITFL